MWPEPTRSPLDEARLFDAAAPRGERLLSSASTRDRCGPGRDGEAQAAANVRLGRADSICPGLRSRSRHVSGTEDGQPFRAPSGHGLSLWITRALSSGRPARRDHEPETRSRCSGSSRFRARAPRSSGMARQPHAARPSERPCPCRSRRSVRPRADRCGRREAHLPDLPVTRRGIFVRLRLDEPPPRERWGAPLRSLERRPRAARVALARGA